MTAITLYYIQDISAEDEPYFSTSQEQYGFFGSHEVQQIDTGFYPPHYRNTIRLDDADVSFDSQVNYLGLWYNNKEYYYFIRSISYINEGVIELDVEMDTIQTYMFNMDIHSAIIERKFIDRWKSVGDAYVYNRDYIRENISTGNYQVYKFVDLTDDFKENAYDRGAIVVVAGDPAQAVGCGSDYKQVSKTTIKTPYVSFDVINCGNFAIIPVGENIDATYSVVNEVGASLGSYNLYTPTYLSTHYPSTYMVYYYPYNFFTSYINITGATTIMIDSSGYVFRDFVSTKQPVYIPYIDTMSITYKNITYSIDMQLEVQTSIGIDFSSKLVPALIDENYMTLDFGDNTANTSYLLYYAKGNAFKLNIIPDISSGSMVYSITDIMGVDDRYYNAVSSNQLTLDVINEPFRQWYTYNRCSIGGAIAQDAVQIAGSLSRTPQYASNIKAQQSKQLFTANKDMFLSSNKKYYTKALKNRSYNDYMDIRGDSTYSMGVNPPTNIIGLATQIGNTIASPNTIKSSGNIISVATLSGYKLHAVEYRVNDFEYCAQYYHRNGYLVNEVWVKDEVDLLPYLNTRYYYFIAKMSHIDFSLNILQSEDIMDSIVARFVDGVRFWNISGPNIKAGHIGNYKYDNVELAYIGG